MTIDQIRSEDGTGTLSYLIEDEKAGTGVLIDPNIEDLDEIRRRVAGKGLKITHLIDTHTHVDHVSAAGELRGAYQAEVVMHENTKNKWKVLDQGDKFGIGDTLRANARVPVDRYVGDNETITSGGLSLKLLFTPGHTDNHLSVLAGENLFTGDLLLIGQAGRSDLPGGDPGQQYDSLTTKILPNPDHYRIYPGHDYSGNEYALLGEEKKTNPFLTQRSRSEFIDFVKDFFPPIAEAMADGGKMSLQCGVQRVLQQTDDIRNIIPRELSDLLTRDEKTILLDVREPAELDRFGAIDNVMNIPVSSLDGRISELPADKNTAIICVCQTGGRSLEATHFLQRQGYTNVRNLAGGTTAWAREGYPVVKPRHVS